MIGWFAIGSITQLSDYKKEKHKQKRTWNLDSHGRFPEPGTEVDMGWSQSHNFSVIKKNAKSIENLSFYIKKHYLYHSKKISAIIFLYKGKVRIYQKARALLKVSFIWQLRLRGRGMYVYCICIL